MNEKVGKLMSKLTKKIPQALALFILVFLNACSKETGSFFTGYKNQQLTKSSENSLKSYYSRIEKKKLSMGLLRQDGGGLDTPFDEDDIVAAFEKLAFYNEYKVGQNQLLPSSEQVSLGKWQSNINISAKFGSSVSTEQKDRDLKEIDDLILVLSRASKHKIKRSKQDVNMYIIVGNQREIADLVGQISVQMSEFDPERTPIITQLPKEIHCLAMTSVSSKVSSRIESALVIIRSELPEVMRKACFHEEIAQSLGLTNDSHLARPSIFNDDDEFATLTKFDELLIRILYDDRLKTGMSRLEASELVPQIVNGLDKPL